MFFLDRLGKLITVMVGFVLIGSLLFVGNQGAKQVFEGNDDVALLNDANASIIETFSERGVLGASTEFDLVCSTDKPVIGWINYSGKKVVVERIPFGEENAIVCFESEEEANEEGYEAA